jgi:2-haloacid dehalogenase
MWQDDIKNLGFALMPGVLQADRCRRNAIGPSLKALTSSQEMLDYMALNRRQFLNIAGALSAGWLMKGSMFASVKSPIKAIAFDAFPIFDPRPVFTLCETLFPGKGAELSNAWRTRQFEYTWLRSMSQRYADFWQVTEDSLIFAAKLAKVDLTAEKRDQLMHSYLALKTWPDVPPALKKLKDAGFRLIFLSNFSPEMLNANIKNSALGDIFEQALSTDEGKTYKPDPRAYALGINILKLKKEEIMFVAFASWDAVGGKSFGYPTYWMNRLNLPQEELNSTPDATGAGMADLLSFLHL